MSTFRLEPEHFILTTGTFNLIVKDRIAFRLSGALSVRTDSLTGIRTSSKPFNRIVSRNRCQPFAITGFPPVIHNGECLSGRENSNAENSLRQRDDALPLAMAGLSRRMPKQKTVNLKRSLGGSAFRETLQELCSRIRTPRFGVNWRLSIFDVKLARKIQAKLRAPRDRPRI